MHRVHARRRPSFVAAVSAVTAALALGTLSPASAATGGTPAPGWHWVDSDEPGGPVTTSIDLSLTGDRNSQGGDTGSTQISAPFDVTLQNATAREITVSFDGWLGIGDSSNAATLRVMEQDMVSANIYSQVVGEPGSRQLIIQVGQLQRWRQPEISTTPTITFFEGRPGALVTYRNVGTSGRETTQIGLSNGYLAGAATEQVSYDAPITEGLALWWTNEAATSPPASVVPTTDTFGYRAIAGQPTGFADLDGTGRVQVSSDEASRTLKLPFPMRVYGTDYDSLTVDTNTSFRFGTGSLPHLGSNLPDASLPDSGLLFGDDLVTTISTQVRGTAPHRQYVIRWTGSRYRVSGPEGVVDIEMVLFEDGQDIGVRYADVPDAGVQPGGRPVINHDGDTRLRLAEGPQDGDSLLFTLDADRTQAILPSDGSNTDGFGYRALRSDEPGGPTYNWIDATAGQAHLVGADTGTAVVDTPFPVSLYGTSATGVAIAADGYLYLGRTDHYAATHVPDSNKAGLIQPYTADLVVPNGVFTHTVGTAPHRRFVVSWEAVPYRSQIPVHHQIVFHEDSSDVLVQYRNIVESATTRTSIAAINRNGMDRLMWSRTGQDIADQTAVLLTTDRLVGVAPPAQLRTDDRPVSLGNRVVNVSEENAGAVRQTITIDGPDGLAPSQLRLEQQADGGWSELPLTAVDGRLVATVAATDGDAFGPGTDLSTPLRLSAGPAAPLGRLHVTSTLESLVDSAVAGTIAKATRPIELIAQAPDAPSGLSVTEGDGSARLSWTPQSNGGRPLTGYTVTASPGDHTVAVGPDATSAQVTGLTNGTAYTLKVTATNALGSSPVASTTATPYGVPGQPGTPSATAGDGSATVSWAPAAPNGRPVTAYTVTAAPGNVTKIVDGSTTGTVVPGLVNGTAYTFTVQATNLAGAGAVSARSAAVTPVGLPGRPTGLSVTAGSRQLTATWTPPEDDGGTPITGYTVRVRPVGSSDPGTPHQTTGTSATITGLANARSYEVTVTARNAVGESPVSDPASASPSLPAVTALSAEGAMSDTGEPGVKATWTLPAGATGAVACLVRGSAPAAASCTGQSVGSNLPLTAVNVPAGEPVTLTVFPTDADGRGQGASVTLTRSTLVAGQAAIKTIAGKPVVLTADLMGGPAGPRTATLWSKVRNGAWTQVATVDSTGTFTAPAQAPTRLTSYRWQFEGANGIVGSASEIVTVSVAPVIATSLTPSSIKVGRATKIWGTLSPAMTGTNVTVQVKVRKRWKTVDTAVVKRQKMPTGKKLVGYALPIAGTKKGSYTYRVISPATADNVAATGPAVVLKVK